jgi:hypothetical protein
MERAIADILVSVKTPLSLGALALLVAYFIFKRLIARAPAESSAHLRGPLPDQIAFYVFLLALVGILLGGAGWIIENFDKERRLAGIVLDEANTPVGGAEVFVEGVEDLRKISQPDGNFELRAPKGMSQYVVRARLENRGGSVQVPEAKVGETIRIFVRESCVFRLSLVDDGAYVAEVMNCASPQRSKVLTDAALSLKEEYRKVVAQQLRSYTGEHFQLVTKLIGFMLKIDPRNGHGLYYAGTVKRRLYMNQSASTGFLSSHDDFFQYLNVENGLPEDERGMGIVGDGCYALPRGYCGERTAWINHLIANDLYAAACREKATGERESYFAAATRHAQAALDRYDGGFGNPTQRTSTSSIFALASKRNCV